MEDLGKLDWVLTLVDEEISRDKAENAIVEGRLGIETLDVVSDLTETVEFF